MKIRILPLPSPWDANIAVLHLYRAWTNRGKAKLDKIPLSNPHMIGALVSLCASQETPAGTLHGVGAWRLHCCSDGTAEIIITHHKEGDLWLKD